MRSWNGRYGVFREGFPASRVLANEPLSKHTTFRVGGPADLVFFPRDIKDTLEALEICGRDKLPHMVMGGGSNILFRDKGFRGVVINFAQGMDHIALNNNQITAGCGVSLSRLAGFLADRGLDGFAFAAGIPGTLGGAVYMNAGAYGAEMKDVTVSVKAIDEKGLIKIIPASGLCFGYRNSIFQKNPYIIIEAVLDFCPGDPIEIRRHMKELNNRRRESQPLEWPSGGSVFKRPVTGYAGRLIEESGLKGYSIGGAQVSEKHCGFIINKGNAAARDIMELISHIQETVRIKTGVALETEIRIAGEE